MFLSYEFSMTKIVCSSCIICYQWKTHRSPGSQCHLDPSFYLFLITIYNIIIPAVTSSPKDDIFSNEKMQRSLNVGFKYFKRKSRVFCFKCTRNAAVPASEQSNFKMFFEIIHVVQSKLFIVVYLPSLIKHLHQDTKE